MCYFLHLIEYLNLYFTVISHPKNDTALRNCNRFIRGMGKLANIMNKTKATQFGKCNDDTDAKDSYTNKPTTPTVLVEDFSSDTCNARQREDSISSTKSEPDFLSVAEFNCQKIHRSKSTDCVEERQKDIFLRRASSYSSLEGYRLTETECTCVPHEERKSEINGSQLSPFYGLWKRDIKTTLSKRIEQPRFMRRSSYRQCGCKTREYEKQCSDIKIPTCIQHGV